MTAHQTARSGTPSAPDEGLATEVLFRELARPFDGQLASSLARVARALGKLTRETADAARVLPGAPEAGRVLGDADGGLAEAATQTARVLAEPSLGVPAAAALLEALRAWWPRQADAHGSEATSAPPLEVPIPGSPCAVLLPRTAEVLGRLFREMNGLPESSEPTGDAPGAPPSRRSGLRSSLGDGAFHACRHMQAPASREHRSKHGSGAYYFLQPRPAARRGGGTAGVERLRADFPILDREVNGRPLAWLDNAATSQKPSAVIDRVSAFYREINSNVHRGAHTLAAEATEAYEDARQRVARYVGATTEEELVFVRGTTEAINLVANSFGQAHVGEGDEILVTTLEHHSNIVPWQQLCERTGARLRVAPIDEAGQVVLEEYATLLGPRTKIAAFAHASNVLGTVLPVREMADLAHAHGAVVLVDGAQSIPHLPIDVEALGCDFFCFSGHKMFAPTGIGALWGRRDLLESMAPWQGGGNMIEHVGFEQTTYAPAPQKFEAGTGSLASAVGLGAAVDYLSDLDMPSLAAHERRLLEHATEALSAISGLRLIGTAAEKLSVVTFVVDGVDSEVVGRRLDQEGVAVRAGHHCAQPTLARYGLESAVRASMAFYNTHAEIERLAAALAGIR